MMQIISTDYIKAHSRLSDSIMSEESSIIELYGESAESTVLNMLNRSLDDLVEEYGQIPAPVKHACLMLVDHSYTQRTPASPQNLYSVPYTIDALIRPYMIL